MKLYFAFFALIYRFLDKVDPGKHWFAPLRIVECNGCGKIIEGNEHVCERYMERQRGEK